MNRKTFLKKSTIGLSTLSLMTIASSCQTKAEESTSTKTEPIQLTAKFVKDNEGMNLNVIGDNQTIKITGEDTNGTFSLIEQNNQPGIGIPMHVHENEDEIFQVLEGEVEMKIGEETKTLQPGDLIFCPRGIPHSWRVVGENNAKAMLSIFPAGLEAMFEELSKLPAGPPDLKKVAEICGKYKITFV